MNQRPGKIQSRADPGGISEMTLKKFCDQAAMQLIDGGEGDAAFFFEQVSDHLVQGKPLPTDREGVRRLFGL